MRYHLPRWLTRARVAAGLVVFLLLFLFWGIASTPPRPRAPELQPVNTVYESAEAGLRFVPPRGWNERSRLTLPPRQVGECLLIRYKLLYARFPTFYRVSIARLPADASLVEYMAKPIKGERWTQVTDVEQVTVGGLSGVRADFKGSWDDQDVLKEVTVVRRDERVYKFTAIFPPNDSKSRRETRESIASVTWMD